MKFLDRLIANSEVFKTTIDAVSAMGVEFNRMYKIVSTVIQSQNEHRRLLEEHQHVLEELCLRSVSSKMSRDNSLELNVPLSDDKKASNKPN